MSLFVCDKCHAIENTALGRYHTRFMDGVRDKGLALCSECAPTSYFNGEEFWVDGRSFACCRKVKDACGKCVLLDHCEDAFCNSVEMENPRPMLNLLKKAIRERGKR